MRMKMIRYTKYTLYAWYKVFCARDSFTHADQHENGSDSQLLFNLKTIFHYYSPVQDAFSVSGGSSKTTTIRKSALPDNASEVQEQNGVNDCENDIADDGPLTKTITTATTAAEDNEPTSSSSSSSSSSTLPEATSWGADFTIDTIPDPILSEVSPQRLLTLRFLFLSEKLMELLAHIELLNLKKHPFDWQGYDEFVNKRIYEDILLVSAPPDSSRESNNEFDQNMHVGAGCELIHQIHARLAYALKRSYDVLASMIQLRFINDDMKRQALPKPRLLQEFDGVNFGVMTKTQDFYLYLLKYLYSNCYKRYNKQCYMPSYLLVEDVDARTGALRQDHVHTHAWKRECDISEAIIRSIHPKEFCIDQWKNFSSKVCEECIALLFRAKRENNRLKAHYDKFNFVLCLNISKDNMLKSATHFLETTHDSQFNDIVRSRNSWSFRNGIWSAEERQFYYYPHERRKLRKKLEKERLDLRKKLDEINHSAQQINATNTATMSQPPPPTNLTTKLFAVEFKLNNFDREYPNIPQDLNTCKLFNKHVFPWEIYREYVQRVSVSPNSGNFGNDPENAAAGVANIAGDLNKGGGAGVGGGLSSVGVDIRSQSIRASYRDPMDIPTPIFDQMLNDQHFDREVKKWVYILLIRCIYELGTHDDFQVMLFLWGLGGTGKSTAINFVKSFWEAMDVAVLNNTVEPNYPVAHCPGKNLVIAPDVKRNWKLEMTMFQNMISMVSDEKLLRRKKREKAN
jgi:hypothetical protein